MKKSESELNSGIRHLPAPMTGAIGNETPSEYFARTARTAQEVFQRYPVHALDEQAGPAYLQGLAVSRSIFWSRLRQVCRLLPKHGSACVDFGCGFGLLLPLLKRRFDQLAGVDLMPDLARGFLQQWSDNYGECLSEIEIVNTLEAALPGRPLDLIIALDVLEHVDNLEVILDAMAHRLSPDGLIIVSGPTENWLYKLGRRIVGFSGDYHVRDIHAIRKAMNHRFDIQSTRKLPRFAPLFHIITGTPRH